MHGAKTEPLGNRPYAPPRHIVTSSVLVTNEMDEVLLVKTNIEGWTLPGGQVEVGEDVLEAAVRETQEEAGIVVDVVVLGSIHANLSRGQIIMGFLATYQSGELLAQKETDEALWVPRAEALSRITHPAIFDRVSDLLNFDGRVLYRAYRVDPYLVVSQQRV
jgi:8-oxo-dGTP diphosphatase